MWESDRSLTERWARTMWSHIIISPIKIYKTSLELSSEWVVVRLSVFDHLPRGSEVPPCLHNALTRERRTLRYTLKDTHLDVVEVTFHKTEITHVVRTTYWTVLSRTSGWSAMDENHSRDFSDHVTRLQMCWY